MRSMAWVAVSLTMVVLTAVILGADDVHVRSQLQQKKVALGVSPRDVRMAIGEPTKITRTRTYWETREDWVYGEGRGAISLTFEAGRLTRIADGGRTDPK